MNANPLPGESELHAVVRAEDAAQVARILSQHADPNSLNAQGETPLHLAARAGHRDIAALLLQAGADPNARTQDGQNPRSLAAAAGYMGVVFLLEQWAEQHHLALEKQPAVPAPDADMLTQLKRALSRVWIPITIVIVVVGCILIYVLSTLTFGR